MAIRMTTAAQWVHDKGRRRLRELTRLNQRLDAAYQRCLDRGGHVASGETVSRDFGNRQLVLPVCRRCKCPYGGPKIVSSKQRWNGTDGGAG